MPMISITCELCGSNQLIRNEDGTFQCEYCGTKYTLESARQLMSGDVVRTKDVDFQIEGGTLVKYSGEDTEAVIPEGVRAIGGYAFSGMAAIERVVIPSTVVEIGDGSFSGCKRLKSIEIPMSVESIGSFAFSECASLEQVSLPGITDIKSSAFHGCRSLRHIDFPHHPISIDSYAFKDCPSLSEVEFHDNVSICKEWPSPTNRASLVFDIQLADYTEDDFDKSLIAACQYGKLDHFPSIHKPSLKRVVCSTQEIAQTVAADFEDHLLSTAVSEFDSYIRAEKLSISRLGLFDKKEKQRHQEKIDNLKKLKEMLPDYCVTIEVRG